MPLRIKIELIQDGVSPEFLCFLLEQIKGEAISDCVQKLSTAGYIEVYVSQQEYEKLKSYLSKYGGFNLLVYTQQEQTSTDLRSDAEQSAKQEDWLENFGYGYIKENVGFVVVWCAFYLLLILLSFVPILGIIANLLISISSPATVLALMKKLNEEHSLRSATFGNVFNMFAPAFGFWLGSFIISIVSIIFLIILLFAFGGLGLLASITSITKEEELLFSLGFSALMALLITLILFLYWLFCLPLIYARIYEKGLSLENAFISAFFPFFPEGFKRAFSNAYLGLGAIWSVVVGLVFIPIIISFVLVITIPVALFLIFWIHIYTAMTSLKYLQRQGLLSPQARAL